VARRHGGVERRRQTGDNGRRRDVINFIPLTAMELFL